MYYLPDDSLPRPGDQVVTSGVGFSFPKGIPIGTVRESTRGMEGNKQYVVIEPQADFQHLEYVIILRYKPEAEAIEGRDSTAVYNEYVPLVTARPLSDTENRLDAHVRRNGDPDGSAVRDTKPDRQPDTVALAYAVACAHAARNGL